jgi:hypothetical protein
MVLASETGITLPGAIRVGAPAGLDVGDAAWGAEVWEFCAAAAPIAKRALHVQIKIVFIF